MNPTAEISFPSTELAREMPSIRPAGGIAFPIHSVRAALLGVAFLLPLVVVPGLEQPFSRPKLVLWASAVLCGFAICGRRVWNAWLSLPQSLRLPLMVWLAALGLSALFAPFAAPESLVLPVTGVGWFILVLALRPDAARLAWTLVLSGSAIAAVALAQFFRADAFSALGWLAAPSGSSRMRLFATLGNPNFVAAFLSGLLPLTFSLAIEYRGKRRLLMGLSALQAAAILATGSRAPVLALGSAFLWVMCLRARRILRCFALAAVCVALLAAAASPARDLRTTLSGRSYIWSVSVPHLGEHFLLGLGPGGFASAFPAWETDYWRNAPDERGRNFAGLEDHAHNDYIEIFADYGIGGLADFVAVLLVFLSTAFRRHAADRQQRSSCLAGASAGAAALAAVSLVDFPMMRPAETFLLWSLMALSLLEGFTQAKQIRPKQISD